MTSSHFKLLATLLVAGGCSQILGISDYQIVDDPTGEGGDTGQGGDGAVSGKGGKAGAAGDAGAPSQAGDGPGPGPGGSDQGGMPGQGGSGTVGGAGGEGGEPPIIRTLIPCDSVECCTDAGGVVDELQLLQNVDFEAGQEWWDEYSDLTYDLIVSEDDTDTVNAHAGKWFVWMGGAEDEGAVLSSPTLEIPADTGWVTLSGWRYLVFDSATATTDFAVVQLWDENDFDTPYENIYLWDSAVYDTNSWTKFEVSGAGELYAGLPLQLWISGFTDATADDPVGQAASNFFFDDISFVAARCYEP